MISPKSVIALADVRDTGQLSKLIEAGMYMHEIEDVCAALRIQLKDLFPKKIADFAGDDVSPEVAELRFLHYEKKRQYRLSKILPLLSRSKDPHAPARNRSQDLTKSRKLNTECLFSGTRNRYGGASVSPTNLVEDLPPSPRDLAEMSFSETSTQDRHKSTSERRMLVQERSLQLRLAEIQDKIARLREKESRFEHAKEELRQAEAERQRKREQRSVKIRNNLEKKYREMEAFEKREVRKGMTPTPEPKPALSRASVHQVPSKTFLSPSDDEDYLEQQMLHIQSKLESSAARASNHRTLKALTLAAKHDYYRKAKAKVQAGEASKEHEMFQLALKLQEQQAKSQRLREQRLKEMMEKTVSSNRKKQGKGRSERKRRSETIQIEDESREDKEKEAEKAKMEMMRVERANLKRLDVEENLNRERCSLNEMKEIILHKHQHLASSVERRSLERSSQHQSLLKEDFQRQVQRERMKETVNGKILELHSRFLRTIDA